MAKAMIVSVCEILREESGILGAGFFFLSLQFRAEVIEIVS